MSLTAVSALLLLGYGGLRVVQYAGLAVTWAMRDARPIERLITAHVPPGSEVLGPIGLPFFLVERAGSRYITVYQESGADWTRWTSAFEPAAGWGRIKEDPSHPQFLIWPSNRPLPAMPASVACELGDLLGTYEPPGPPSWMKRIPWSARSNVGFAGLQLYALKELNGRCPELSR
jgi:hypothetical protein